MVRTILSVTLGLALAASTAAAPPLDPLLEARNLDPKCTGMACSIATLSGSTGKVYNAKRKPKDRNTEGNCCILSYNPSAAPRMYEFYPELQSQCGGGAAALARRAFTGNTLDDASVGEGELEDELDARAPCTPYTLIFAKGTFEEGPIGGSVGPALQEGLEAAAPGQWTVKGLNWANDDSGNFCLGLPGGDVAKRKLEKTAAKCPGTKIVMAGYSQGAMVVRNAVAYADSGVKSVAAIVTFGDPFKGAKVKGYSKPIAVYCHRRDRVCDGRYIVNDSHTNYPGPSTDRAVKQIMRIVA